MEEIKAIIEKHDIAAMVILHTPGFTEYLNKIDPSYSCAKVAHNGSGIEVRLKGAEVGKEKARQLATDTFNLVTLMADTLAPTAMMYMQAQEFLKAKWGGTEGPGTHTSHAEQNS